MGQRANLILVRDGRYDLRYSHWAATTLPRDLFWGPQHATEFTAAQPTAGNGWLDDVWAEGGSVIDAERRVFRLFGGDDLRYDVPLRRLYMSLLGEVWQGWEVGWAEEGIADLADYVGYPREQVISAEDDRMIAPDLEPPQELEWVDTVGSVRLVDGSLKLFPLAGEAADYFLEMGPPLVKAAAAQPGMSRLPLGEWTSSFPTGGFHLDLEAQRLLYWTARDQPGVEARIAARWPGWSVTWLRDRYEDQLAACGGALSFPDRTRVALFGELRSMLLQESSGSPVDTILWFAERQRAAGSVVEIDAKALRDDRLEVSPATRSEILHRAAVRLGLS